jgi:hypothetical protein
VDLRFTIRLYNIHEYIFAFFFYMIQIEPELLLYLSSLTNHQPGNIYKRELQIHSHIFIHDIFSHLMVYDHDYKADKILFLSHMKI